VLVSNLCKGEDSLAGDGHSCAGLCLTSTDFLCHLRVDKYLGGGLEQLVGVLSFDTPCCTEASVLYKYLGILDGLGSLRGDIRTQGFCFLCQVGNAADLIRCYSRVGEACSLRFCTGV
jgi:hypothetical protein